MDQQDFYIQKTYASLQDCLSRYTNNLELKASIKKELQVIELGLERVNNNVIKIIGWYKNFVNILSFFFITT